MNQKQTVLHIIDSLGRGGAETLLVGVVNSMPQFEHIIVSLMPINEFGNQLVKTKVYFLKFKGFLSVIPSAKKINKIISAHNVSIVHAHLYWSSIVSRFATPKGVKLVNSYHNVLYGKSGSNYPFHSKLLDRLSYSKRVKVLCVSKEVLSNVEFHLGVKDGVVLYNYVEDIFYKNHKEKDLSSDTLRLVAVGNLKPQKNYAVLIEGLSILKKQFSDQLVSVDVYGRGPLLNSLLQLANELQVRNIKFLGAVSDVATRLFDYDAYILPSSHEGFGIAVAEAMAVGLPVIVSDIPVLREVTSGQAVFFNPHDPETLSNAIKSICLEKTKLKEMSVKGHQHSQLYRKSLYMEKLFNFYSSK